MVARKKRSPGGGREPGRPQPGDAHAGAAGPSPRQAAGHLQSSSRPQTRGWPRAGAGSQARSLPRTGDRQAARARAGAPRQPGHPRTGARPAAARPAVYAVALIVLALPWFAAPAAGETRVQSELDTLATLMWNHSEDELGLMASSTGRIDFWSPRDPNVQGRLQLVAHLAQLGQFGDAADGAAPPASIALLSVPRASIRFRFPVTEQYTMRMTAGRDRVSWGIGSLFNAGDLIFGADGTEAADFTDPGTDDIRDETRWLVTPYFPVGDLGYLEAVALPPLPDLTVTFQEHRDALAQLLASGNGTGNDASGGNDAPESDDETSDPAGTGDTTPLQALEAPPISRTSAGARFHSAFGPLTVEPAYLYSGAEEAHYVALSLQGNLEADIYASARLRFDEETEDIATTLEEDSVITGGAFYTTTVGYNQSLSARLEGLVRPGAEWENIERRNAEYGLLLYPEIIWAPTRTLNVFARSIVSPIDRSAFIAGGVQWNVFQGFRMLAFGAAQAGDDTAIYGWDRPGGAAVSAGFSYRF